MRAGSGVVGGMSLCDVVWRWPALPGAPPWADRLFGIAERPRFHPPSSHAILPAESGVL
jgi:hypothetical protein